MTHVPATVDRIDPVRVVVSVESVGLTPEQFYRLCGDNRDLRLELTARNELIIMSPAGSNTGARNSAITAQLHAWASRDATGIAFDSSAGFTLSDGSVLSPDASWIRLDRWRALSPEERERFAPICPDFVIELRSPSDTVAELQAKMSAYMANGVGLGWLIDPFERRVYVYRPGKTSDCLENPDSVNGDPVVPGFELDLSRIW